MYILVSIQEKTDFYQQKFDFYQLHFLQFLYYLCIIGVFHRLATADSFQGRPIFLPLLLIVKKTIYSLTPEIPAMSQKNTTTR